MIHLLTVEARVANGIALLQQDDPTWVQKINLHTLDLSTGTYCVLGQLYGSYDAGAAHLLGERNTPGQAMWAAQSGFLGAVGGVSYPELQAEWVHCIVAERAVS